MSVEPTIHLEAAANVAADLRALGLEPVLVGGMALVVLGSQRVTRGFDFVIRHPVARMERLVEALYARGFELVAKIDDMGRVRATLSNQPVATARLAIDQPASAYFYNPETLLRIDLLFDFPLPAAELAERAMRTKIAGRVFAIAAEQDLLALKRIAMSARAFAGDAQDIAFLEARLNRA